MPLIIAADPGAELRRPLGIAIIGGLIVSRLLTLCTTPVIYLLREGLRRRQVPSARDLYWEIWVLDSVSG